MLLFGEQEAWPPYANKVIYRDALGTLCRRWNWKEADRTKLTETTQNAIRVIERLPPLEVNTTRAAIGALAALVEAHCGGTLSTALLDVNTPQMNLF